MVTGEQVQGGWTELKGAAKKKWGELNNDELKQFEGSVDEFVGMLQRRTGEARSEVEWWLRQADERLAPLLDRTADAAREYWVATTQRAEDGMHRLREQAAAGQAEAERLVRRRPTESVAVAFGVGIITGVVVGLLTRNRG